jgi:hypothetical protein
MIIKSAIISLLMSMIAISDTNIKMHLALLLSELFNGELWIWLRSKLNFLKTKEISIPETANDYPGVNPVFSKFQDYITSKYAREIESCELVPRNGEIDFNLSNTTGKKFTDTYVVNSTVHDIEIYITDDSMSIASGSVSTSRKRIVLKSKTATSEDIKKYVRKISGVQYNNKNSIIIYKPMVNKKAKKNDPDGNGGRIVEWHKTTARTYKTLENTIYSEEVTKNMFDDLDHFMSDEAWYIRRGIPYKRGYFLHSTPGQGKTSIAKIIANKYDMPVFCLDLTIVSDNETLSKLIMELNYHTDGKYILLMEDADRADFFKGSMYRENPLSMDCLLNIIDGIAEPHGRITIITANNPEVIIRHDALMRPGRIDKILELKCCDETQLRKLYDLFYMDDSAPNSVSGKNAVDWSCWKLKTDLTAAYVTKLLQENVNRPDVFLRIIGTKIKGTKKKVSVGKDSSNSTSVKKSFADAVNDGISKTKESKEEQDKDSDEDLDILDGEAHMDKANSVDKELIHSGQHEEDVIHDEKDSDEDSELDEEAAKAIKYAKEAQEREANKEDDDDEYGGNRRRRRVKSQRYKKSNNVKSRIANAKSEAKRAEKRIKMYERKLETSSKKIPVLLDKLKVEQEKEARKKLIAKGKKKAEYMAKLSADNKKEELISMLVDEEEYETPAFMLNSIPVDAIDTDTVVTYETTDVINLADVLESN